MFGSHYVAKAIYDTATATAAVVTAVGDRIERRFVPQGVDANGNLLFITPFIVYRMTEPSLDDGALGQPATSQLIRFEIAIYDDQNTTDRIITAAEAFDAALQAINVTVAGKGWQITCRRENELPDLDPDYGLPFLRVGGNYAFDVG